MPQSGSILVVDDTPLNLKLLADTLAAAGYQVQSAANGELALAAVTTWLPDLILLDICMPELDGFEVFRRLQARPTSRHIPVMFITGSNENTERLTGLKLGAVDFITKPFQREELLARVHTHLELRRLRVQLEQQAADLRQANAQLLAELAERKQTEKARHQEQTFTRTLLENITEGVVACDASGTLVLFNRAAREWHGMDALDLPPEEWSRHYNLYAADGITPLATESIPLVRALRGETIREVEMTIVAQGQPPRLVQASGQPFFDAQHHQLGAVMVLHDLTQRRQMEDKLRQLSRAVEQSPASIVITDPAGLIEYVNPQFAEVTGYTMSEVLGTNPRVLKSGHSSATNYQEMWQCITAGKVWHGEFHNKKKNGEFHWESASISPIRNASGQITHYVAIKTDITDRKQTEAERDRLIQELQTALARVKTLSGLLPICAGCKKIRDDQGYWNQVESYFEKHSDATFTHSLCPNCMPKFFPGITQGDVERSK